MSHQIKLQTNTNHVDSNWQKYNPHSSRSPIATTILKYSTHVSLCVFKTFPIHIKRPMPHIFL